MYMVRTDEWNAAEAALRIRKSGHLHHLKRNDSFVSRCDYMESYGCS